MSTSIGGVAPEIPCYKRHLADGTSLLETTLTAFPTRQMSSKGPASLKSSSDAIDGVEVGRAFERAEERRAVRLLDYSLLPIMTMFYLLSFLVRFRSSFVTRCWLMSIYRIELTLVEAIL